MDARSVKTPEDARKLIEKSGHSHVKVGVFDIDGVMRGKYMSREKAISALEKGFGFCDVVLGWDVKDQLYDNTRFTGWHSGYPDAPVRLLPSSCRQLPFEDNIPFFLGEFDDSAEKVCPRGTLRRVLDYARDLGFEVDCGFEYEFFVFDETPHSLREKGFSGLTPVTPGEFGYSMLRCSDQQDIYRYLLEVCQALDFPLEGLHEETGPGVLEAAITHSTALEAADRAALFKTFSKIALNKFGKTPTFMAKWSPDYPGQSGHIHLSLHHKGKAAFFSQGEPHGISEVMRHFVGGLQKMTPEWLAMIAPTINSYRRLIPGFWAPTEASVGVDNRTCAIRLIPGNAENQRLEFRLGAADANPYLILAAVVAAGCLGIEESLEPSDFVKGNAYEQTFPPSLQLPRTLGEAARRFAVSEAAKRCFGEAFVEHYAATREWEEREFQKHISRWELERYFEII